MKKFLTILAVIACMAVAFTFVGCSKAVDEPETPVVDEVPETENQEEVEVPETEETPEEETAENETAE